MQARRTVQPAVRRRTRAQIPPTCRKAFATAVIRAFTTTSTRSATVPARTHVPRRPDVLCPALKRGRLAGWDSLADGGRQGAPYVPRGHIAIGILDSMRSGARAGVLGGIALLAVSGCAAPTSRGSLPPADAPAAAVMDAYLQALVAGDCSTAHALATSTFKPGNGELCGDVVVSSFSLNPEPAAPGRDEVVYATELITEGSSDGTIQRGRTVWFYDLKRQDGVWRLVGGGSGP